MLICLQDFAAYLAFCGIVLHNAQLYETSLLENRRNQVWSTGLSQEYKNYDGQLKSAPFPVVSDMVANPWQFLITLVLWSSNCTEK